jgi:hypothetical protein
MAVIIVNETPDQTPCRYRVQINDGTVLARFEHNRPDGLALCLSKAAKAIEGVNLENPFTRTNTGSEK